MADLVLRDLTRRLATFGATSVVAGAGLAASGRPTVRGFGQQTAAWGFVNLGIAAVGRLRSDRQLRPERLRRVLLVNAGLDVGYALVGAYVAIRRPSFGGRLAPDAAPGHGLAVVVQGCGLFALDVAHAARLQ